MTKGRPTKLTPELIAKAKTYLDQKDIILPSIEDLAIFLDVSRDSIHTWRNEHEEFSDIVEGVLRSQAKALMNNGLTNKWNASITKLILTKHGYRDAIEQESKGELVVKVVSYGDYHTTQLPAQTVPVALSEGKTALQDTGDAPQKREEQDTPQPADTTASSA